MDESAGVGASADRAQGARLRSAVRWTGRIGCVVALCALMVWFRGTSEHMTTQHGADTPRALAQTWSDADVGGDGMTLPPPHTPPPNCGLAIQQQFHCSEYACKDRKVGYINYLYFHECTMKHLKGVSFVVLSLGFLFLLYLLEDTTDHYFCVAIKRAVQALGMSPEVAGVTFLSVGNGASDVFSSIAAFSGGAPKIGIGTLVGAALFVASVVVGAVAIVTGGVEMRRGPFLRETFFLAISCLYLFYAMHDSHVSALEIGGFFIIYGFFVLAVLALKVHYDKQARREEEAAAKQAIKDAAAAGAAAASADPVAPRTSSPIAVPRTAEDDTGGDVEAGMPILGASAGRMGGTSGAPSGATSGAGSGAGAGAGAGAGDGAGTADADAVVLSPRSRRAMSATSAQARPQSPVLQAAQTAGASRRALRLLSDRSLSRVSGPRARRALSDSSVSTMKELQQLSMPPPMLFSKANRFTSSFLDVLGQNPFPGAPRKAVASAFARFATAPSRRQPLLGNRRRPFSSQPGFRGGGKYGATGGRGDMSSAALLERAHGAARDAELSSEDLVRAYQSAQSDGVSRRKSALLTASHAAEAGATQVNSWLLKTREALHPVARVLNWPLKIARNITIPRVEEDCWDWRYCAMCPFFGVPLTGFVVLQPQMTARVGGVIPGIAFAAVLGLVLSVWWALVVPRDVVPTGALRICIVCFAFLTSIIWILIIANELVGIAATFGIVSGLSDSMVGLTILSIGNSVNDLAADVTIARAGFPSMAIAGAYAGPMFNILFGLGVPLLIETLKNGSVSLGSDSLTVNYSLLSATGFIVFSMVAVAVSGFKVTRAIGYMLLALYTAFFAGLVAIQVKH